MIGPAVLLTSCNNEFPIVPSKEFGNFVSLKKISVKFKLLQLFNSIYIIDLQAFCTSKMSKHRFTAVINTKLSKFITQ